MTNFSCGQLVLCDSNPSIDQRRNAVIAQLDGAHQSGSYLRVHAVAVVSHTEFYAAVSFIQGSERIQTYVAGSIQCKRKRDGYWLEFDCFLATHSVPFHFEHCPREVLAAGAAIGMRSVVDPKWLSNCEEYLASQEKAKYLTKGAVFSYESGKPAIVICGRNATHALIINKRKALFIEPKSGGSREDEIDVVLRNFSPLQADHLPVLTDMAGYREVGDLLFDITQPVPVLKARLAKGLKAKQLGRHRAQNQALMSQAIHQVDFSSKFQSGAWFT